MVFQGNRLEAEIQVLTKSVATAEEQVTKLSEVLDEF